MNGKQQGCCSNRRVRRTAAHIVETKKSGGEEIEAPLERAPANVINLIDALRQSVKA